MSEKELQHLTALSVYLAGRHDVILKNWREAVSADPEQTTVESLTRAQFNDHVPHVLEAFEHKLRSRPGGAGAAAADDEKKNGEVKHGLMRWQQGYRLVELMHEWGHLHLCLYNELENFASQHPDVSRETMAEANRELMRLINDGINESTGQYTRLQQAEALGHVRDLQQALSQVNDLEKRRASLIHQAVHDLRGNVQSVSTAAEILRDQGLAEAERAEFAKMLQQGVLAVTTMLGDLMSLARLEAGQERREIEGFDAAHLAREFCTLTMPTAQARSLYLKINGPEALFVEGDAFKVRRILQNLVLNALKYTKTGGVTVSWGEEKERWWLMVQDTGPGLHAGPGAPMMRNLKEATASAREAAEKAPRIKGEIPGILGQPKSGGLSKLPDAQQPGEGIGLSIVKRLCELLDASLELTSTAEVGTTFRIVFPKHYTVIIPPTAAQ